MVIAVDVDGTLFDGVGVAPEATDALRQARTDGHVLLIVTGRRWEEVGTVVPFLELFERVVCEEGGVLVNVATQAVSLLAEPLPPALVAALHDAGVPALDIGRVAIGAPVAWSAVVTDVRDRFGPDRVVVTNKGSVALTPAGCDKGSGLLAAIADVGAVGLPVLAIGDAANDLAMFKVATFGVGVGNADEAVRASGAPLMSAASGLGVAEALRRYLPEPSNNLIQSTRRTMGSAAEPAGDAVDRR